MFKAISYGSDFPAFPGSDRVATSSEISYRRRLSGDDAEQLQRSSTALVAQLQQQQQQQQLDASSSPTIAHSSNSDEKRGIATLLSQPSGSSLTTSLSQHHDADALTDSSTNPVLHINSPFLISIPPTSALEHLIAVELLTPNTSASTPTPTTATTQQQLPAAKEATATLQQQLPAAKDALLLNCVAVNDPKLRPSLVALLPQIRALSNQCFQEDVVTQVTKKSGWKLNLLLTPDETRLLGFLSYRVHGESNSLVEVSRVAICADCRRCGYGHLIMKDVVATAKKLPTVQYVTLSSLVETVSFYQHLGFVRHDDVKFVYTPTNPNEELVENQVYMELKVRNFRRKKAGKIGGKRK